MSSNEEFRYRRIALVGLGAHARRIYLPLLARLARAGTLEVSHLFELKTRSEIVEKSLAEVGLNKTEVIYVNHQEGEQDSIEYAYENNPFDSMIIACDPLYRRHYFEFALKRGVAIFADKPVLALANLALDPIQGEIFLREGEKLYRAFEEKSIPFVIQTQRRHHLGYQFILDYLTKFIHEFKIPVTSLHIQHADGMWVFPNEWDRDHHPYKYGFGKMLHSGYHFVDLLCWILGMTGDERLYDEVELTGKASWPLESIEIWKSSQLLSPKQRILSAKTDSLGEYDINALLQFYQGEAPKTLAHLQLLQHSFSDRDPQKVVVDPYKGTGRVRHERLDIKLSSLLNIQVHSYQSASSVSLHGTEVGQQDHFEVLIFRNSAVCGGDSFQRLNFSKGKDSLFGSHNEAARENLLMLFLKGKKTQSELGSHLMTMRLLSYLYELIAKGRNHFSIIRKSLD